MDGESKIKEVHRTRWFVNLPGQFAVVKGLVEGTEGPMAFWSTGPVPDAKTIIDVPGPV